MHTLSSCKARECLADTIIYIHNTTAALSSGVFLFSFNLHFFIAFIVSSHPVLPLPPLFLPPSFLPPSFLPYSLPAFLNPPLSPLPSPSPPLPPLPSPPQVLYIDPGHTMNGVRSVLTARKGSPGIPTQQNKNNSDFPLR